MTLEELEQLAESGFPKGPWRIDEFGDFLISVCPDEGDEPFMKLGIDEGQNKLITAAPSLLAELIAAKKREKELVEALREIMEYEGGAESALHDEYVIERASALLKDIEQ